MHRSHNFLSEHFKMRSSWSVVLRGLSFVSTAARKSKWHVRTLLFVGPGVFHGVCFIIGWINDKYFKAGFVRRKPERLSIVDEKKAGDTETAAEGISWVETSLKTSLCTSFAPHLSCVITSRAKLNFTTANPCAGQTRPYCPGKGHIHALFLCHKILPFTFQTRQPVY